MQLVFERLHLRKRTLFAFERRVRPRERVPRLREPRVQLFRVRVLLHLRLPAGLHPLFGFFQAVFRLRLPLLKGREGIRAALLFLVHALPLLRKLLVPCPHAVEQNAVLRARGGESRLLLGLAAHRFALFTRRSFAVFLLLFGFFQAVFRVRQRRFTVLHLLLGGFQPSRPRESARAAGGRAARHCAAGLDHLPVERDDAEAVSARPREGKRRVHVFAHDRAGQQISHDRAVFFLEPYKAVRRAAAAALTLQAAFAEEGRADGVERQESRASAVRAAQIFDALLAVFGGFHHDGGRRRAERGVDGGDETAFGRNERGNRAVHPGKTAARCLLHDRLDRARKALEVALHIVQHGRAVFCVRQRTLRLPQRRAAAFRVGFRLPQRRVRLVKRCLPLLERRAAVLSACVHVLLRIFGVAQLCFRAFALAPQAVLPVVHTGKTGLRRRAPERQLMQGVPCVLPVALRLL